MVCRLPKILLFQASDSIPSSIFSDLISCERKKKNMADSSAKWELSFAWIGLDFSICWQPVFELLMKGVVAVMKVAGDGGSGDDSGGWGGGDNSGGNGGCGGGDGGYLMVVVLVVVSLCWSAF